MRNLLLLLLLLLDHDYAPFSKLRPLNRRVHVQFISKLLKKNVATHLGGVRCTPAAYATVVKADMDMPCSLR